MKKFSVGIWDSLFGARVAMEIPNISGEIVRRSVTSMLSIILRTRNPK